MNKTAIKNFAIWARNELIDKVSHRASLYEIYKEEGRTKKEIDVTQNNKILSPEEKKSRKALINKIEEEGYEEVIEEVAYTWFNRFISIRFMEVNDYLPSGIRMFSSINNEFRPEILEEAINLENPWFNKDKVLNLYREGNKEEELFKYLFISKCNELNKILPGMFQKINDYTELLLPDNLIVSGSVLDRMIKDISEEDWREQVQIIGWLYQYYNTDPKDRVINIYKGTIAKNDIPAATQVFTPDWVVRYIVDNSLGKYWIERNPNSKLKEKLEYLILPKDGKIEYIDERIDPKDLKIIDNCVGSGHFLVYEFEVLMEIYKEYGYREREACEYIVRNNLYGLDVDERARQLAYFSVMMKARSYNRRIFEKNLRTNICVITESNNIDRNHLNFLGNSLSENERELAISSLNKLLDSFKDAKNYGSILKLDKIDFELCSRFINEENTSQLPMSMMDIEEFIEEVNNILIVASIMCDKYHVVATNPPYLNRMNASLKNYADKNYKDYKTDLFSMFMYKNFDYCKENGYSGFMTPNVWMSIKSFLKLREFIVNNKSIDSLIQIAKGSFYKESTVDIMAFVLKNNKSNNPGIYINLESIKNDMDVQKKAFIDIVEGFNYDNLYKKNIKNFKKIPGVPISYWVNNNIYNLYDKNVLFADKFKLCQGLKPGLKTFVKKWFEFDDYKIFFSKKIADKTDLDFYKWYPVCNGGNFRKWYGNYQDVVFWYKNGFYIRNYKNKEGKIGSRVQNERFYFHYGLTWSALTSGDMSVRIVDKGKICCGAGYFIDSSHSTLELIGFLNSNAFNYLKSNINNSLNNEVGDLSKVPFIDIRNNKVKKQIENLSKNNIKISKEDWDMNETSWDFKVSPLLANKVDGKIESAYEAYKKEVNERFEKLKSNEEELNRIFIDIYGLQDELTPEVSDRDITIAKIFDKKEEIDEIIKGNKYVMTREDVVKNFLSYFIGCLMGRYSLDEEGLVYAGGDFDTSRYKSFMPDNDGITIFTDDEYFDEDIVTRFQEFLIKIFGPDDLERNLEFIAGELKGKASDSPREKSGSTF